MTNAKRLLLSIFRHGTVASVKEYSGGQQCPCMVSRGGTVPAYSKEWHRRNQAAADCAGTGVINSTTTQVEIKTMVIDAAAYGNAVKGSGLNVEFGTIEKGDLAIYGAVKTVDGANYSLVGLRDENTVTIFGKGYCVKSAVTVFVDGEEIDVALVGRVV